MNAWVMLIDQVARNIEKTMYCKPKRRSRRLPAGRSEVPHEKQHRAVNSIRRLRVAARRFGVEPPTQ